MAKLSIHTQKLDNCINWLKTFPNNAKPTYIHTIDPSRWAVEECNTLDINVIVRHSYKYDFNSDLARDDWLSGKSAYQAASEFIYECQRSEWYPGCWGIVTPPAMAVPGHQHLEWAKEFMESCVVLARQDGKECIVANVPTGNNGFAVDGARYYGCQEYGSPDLLSQAPYHALRYREWYLAIPNAQGLFLLECGVTNAVAGGPDEGYLYHSQTPDYYWEHSLLAYHNELLKDNYVKCAFIFQRSGFKDAESDPNLGQRGWDAFEIENTIIDQKLVNLYAEGEEGNMGYIEQYPDLYNAWVNAGGVENNFKTFVIGQKAARGEHITDEEVEAVVERAHSGINELRLIGLRPLV